ncbi:MAG: hypothetical protein SFY95_08125, partial [Planctomycetota bacterium]|nr:hypothetical protein [Planctomycetota bacterium]
MELKMGRANWRDVVRGWLLLASAVLGVVAPGARAQTCGEQWLPGDPIPGLPGTVVATVAWDPDGAGPRPASIVAGGAFSVPGVPGVTNIAIFDASAGRWSPLGAGLNGPVLALAVMPNGDLIAGGTFIDAGGNANADRIAR